MQGCGDRLPSIFGICAHFGQAPSLRQEPQGQQLPAAMRGRCGQKSPPISWFLPICPSEDLGLSVSRLSQCIEGHFLRASGADQGKIDGDTKVTEQQNDLRRGSPKVIAPALLRTTFVFAVLDRWPSSNVRVHVAWALSFVEGWAFVETSSNLRVRVAFVALCGRCKPSSNVRMPFAFVEGSCGAMPFVKAVCLRPNLFGALCIRQTSLGAAATCKGSRELICRSALRLSPFVCPLGDCSVLRPGCAVPSYHPSCVFQVCVRQAAPG